MSFCAQWSTSQQKCKGLEWFRSPVPQLGTSSTAPAVRQQCESVADAPSPICLQPHAQMGIAGIALSVRGITCGGRRYLISAKTAALRHKPVFQGGFTWPVSTASGKKLLSGGGLYPARHV